MLQQIGHHRKRLRLCTYDAVGGGRSKGLCEFPESCANLLIPNLAWKEELVQPHVKFAQPVFLHNQAVVNADVARCLQRVNGIGIDDDGVSVFALKRLIFVTDGGDPFTKAEDFDRFMPVRMKYGIAAQNIFVKGNG